jgi:hypothetical protein
MAGKSSFELLLETLPDEEFEFKGPVRKAMEELGQKIPKIRDSVLAQSEFSRKMDEVRGDVNLAQQWKKWRDDYWLDEQKMTKSEFEKAEKIQALETDLETARQAALGQGDQMTFEQLGQWSEGFMKDKGLVTNAGLEKTLKEKETSLTDYVKSYTQPVATAALDVPYIMQKHQAEFGEVLDPKPLVKAAAEKNNFDLRDFYEKDWVVERRQKAMQEKHDAEMKKLQEETDAKLKAAEEKTERLKAQAMGQNSGGPVDMGGPELGVLQKQLVPSAPADGEAPKIPDVPLGDGSVAAFAAREYMRKQAERRAS